MLALQEALLPQFFEGMMLVCFGISWPVSILKTWRAKCVKGKSLIFLAMIFIGYLAGTTAKVIFAWPDMHNLPGVTICYIINTMLVGIDIGFYIKYYHNPVTPAAITDDVPNE